jgi:hypothetical protein
MFTHLNSTSPLLSTTTPLVIDENNNSNRENENIKEEETETEEQRLDREQRESELLAWEMMREERFCITSY